MPPLSTHFRIATLSLPSLGIVSNARFFFLGTTAPDAFTPDKEASFAQHHFKKENGPIDLPSFVQAANFMYRPTDDPVWSFTCGYFCHLWLDVFYRDNAERMPIKRPAGVPDSDLKSLVRRETEILNAPFVLNIRNLPLSDLKALKLPPGLEFIDLERFTHLFHKVVKQSRRWSGQAPRFEAIDPAEYAAFLGNVSTLFLNEIQTTA